jgi:hypothetical protein
MYGWNPYMDSSNRVNTIISLNTFYRFLDLTNTPSSNVGDKQETGLALMFITELDTANREATKDQPKILVTSNYNDENWDAIVYGNSTYKVNVPTHLKRFNNPSVTVFFLRMPIESIPNPIKLPSDSELSRICIGLEKPCPQVSNKELFAANLYNTILYGSSKDEMVLSMNRHLDPEYNDTILILYYKAGRNISYESIRKSFSKIFTLKECAKVVDSLTVYLSEATTTPTFPSHELLEEEEPAHKWKEYRSLN